MKRLWTTVPPCLSDLQGFQAVMNETEGLGIIDDSSHYKPLRTGGDRQHEKGGHSHGHEHGHDHGRRDHGHGQGHHGGTHNERTGRKDAGRVINSEIRNEDIITGTQNKVMSAFRETASSLSPDFVLLAYGPSASMIGSDLSYDAETISQESGICAAEVNICGDRDYLYGIGATLETMGHLLLSAYPAQPSTLNILGINRIDWTEEEILELLQLLNSQGWTICSRWGIQETTENLQRAAAASVNLVVSEAGLKLARYMEDEYNIPYLCAAPFGEEACRDMLADLETYRSGTLPAVSSSPEACEPEILVIAEQFTANAIRRTLQAHGLKAIRVLSFYDMDKSQMQPGDQKLISEEELENQLSASSVHMVIANPDYQGLTSSKLTWISLPDGGCFSPVQAAERFNRIGGKLDEALARQGAY